MIFKHTNLDIENEYPKLVRDKIPEIIKENENIDVQMRTLSDDSEYLEYLLKKLIEESTECYHSLEVGNLQEEFADIFELMDAILRSQNITRKDIEKIQNQKRNKRGGFQKRILMLSKN